MLPGYFDYILLQKKKKKTVRLRPDLSPKFLSTLGPKPDSKSPARFTTLTYAVFKFTRLSLYVQYFTQKIIQLIYYMWTFNLWYSFVHTHEKFNVILQCIPSHSTHAYSLSYVIEQCHIIRSVQIIKIVRNFCDA